MDMGNLHIDPWTEKNVERVVGSAFNELLEKLSDERGIWGMEKEEIAKLFFVNGYVNGAIEMIKNNEFLDDIMLLNDEVEYQTLSE